MPARDSIPADARWFFGGVLSQSEGGEAGVIITPNEEATELEENFGPRVSTGCLLPSRPNPSKQSFAAFELVLRLSRLDLEENKGCRRRRRRVIQQGCCAGQ